jgi:hypothetical protein
LISRMDVLKCKSEEEGEEGTVGSVPLAGGGRSFRHCLVYAPYAGL